MASGATWRAIDFGSLARTRPDQWDKLFNTTGSDNDAGAAGGARVQLMILACSSPRLSIKFLLSFIIHIISSTVRCSTVRLIAHFLRMNPFIRNYIGCWNKYRSSKWRNLSKTSTTVAKKLCGAEWLKRFLTKLSVVHQCSCKRINPIVNNIQ